MIEVKNLCFSYGSGSVLDNINFCAEPGSLIAVLGPNGVGKTTLFRCLLGFLKPSSGSVLVNGKDVNLFSKKDLAKEIAYIPQSYNPVFNHTVLDCVLMGLTSSLSVFEQPGPEHEKKALQCLQMLDIEKLAHRGSMKISGGERQLMLIARALVQDAKVLIMDEPTSSLDYGNSFNVMDRISELRDRGYTILFSSHNPDQGLRWADKVLALKDGRVLAYGPAKESLSGTVLKELYGIDVSVNNVSTGNGDYTVCIPLGGKTAQNV
ncbi:MAG: ABC transporter ATP-binding protein [Spirochaetales bacterium]|nr:ABC transporter ATP-binding protein [Spirochaetales bacterium]